MIKFDKWYDGLQTKTMACSSEETKENNDIECYYNIGNYIKKEIEYMQEENNKQKEVLDKIKEYIKENNNQEPWKSVQGDYILELLEEIE